MNPIDQLVAMYTPTPSKARPGLFLRVMRGGERAEWDAFARTAEDGGTPAVNGYAKLLTVTLCDASGERTLKETDVAELLRRVDAKTIEDLALEALVVNGATVEALTAAKKDSAETPPSASGSSSPASVE